MPFSPSTMVAPQAAAAALAALVSAPWDCVPSSRATLSACAASRPRTSSCSPPPSCTERIRDCARLLPLQRQIGQRVSKGQYGATLAISKLAPESQRVGAATRGALSIAWLLLEQRSPATTQLHHNILGPHSVDDLPDLHSRASQSAPPQRCRLSTSTHLLC